VTSEYGHAGESALQIRSSRIIDWLVNALVKIMCRNGNNLVNAAAGFLRPQEVRLFRRAGAPADVQ
jgi:hypothetical protein